MSGATLKVNRNGSRRCVPLNSLTSRLALNKFVKSCAAIQGSSDDGAR